jgi:phosphoserine phosphatase RsbU/P
MLGKTPKPISFDAVASDFGAPQAPGDADASGFARDTILIVDDEPLNRDLLAVVLRDENCNLLFAGDAAAAIDLATAQLPSLILLDVMMPAGGDAPANAGRGGAASHGDVAALDLGYEVCVRLKRDPRTAHIPIIFLSALHRLEERVHGLSLGASDYITKPFDRAEVVARVRSQLAVARLTRELLAANGRLLEKQASLDFDLRAAGEIQRALMPARNLDHPPYVQIACRLYPSDQVGGDICNCYYIDEDHLAAYIVDVCGHGVPAAMLAVAVSQSLAPPSLRRSIGGRPSFDPAMLSPSEVLRRLDREYPFERFDKFFTICYLVLNTRTGEFRYSLAGHPRPVVVRKCGDLELLDAGGTIIGMSASTPFDEGTGWLEPGDLIILYTDGLTEGENPRGNFFGEDALNRSLRGVAGSDPEIACEKIMSDLIGFSAGTRFRDDVTLMAVRYVGCGIALSVSAGPDAGPRH